MNNPASIIIKYPFFVTIYMYVARTHFASSIYLIEGVTAFI